MNKELEELLYKDGFGNSITLEDNLYLDTISKQKIVRLQSFLNSEITKYERYQIVLLLISWGCEDNLKDGDELISNYELEILDEHRHKHVDLRYDRIAEALGLFYNATNNIDLIRPLLKKLLSNFDKWYFEGRLQQTLEEICDTELLTDIIAAIELCINKQKFFKASTLLPILARLNPSAAILYIEKFMPFSDENYSPAEFSAIALKYINSSRSLEILNSFLFFKNELIKEKAIESLEYLKSKS
jgi:hypothetical protein